MEHPLHLQKPLHSKSAMLANHDSVILCEALPQDLRFAGNSGLNMRGQMPGTLLPETGQRLTSLIAEAEKRDRSQGREVCHILPDHPVSMFRLVIRSFVVASIGNCCQLSDSRLAHPQVVDLARGTSRIGDSVSVQHTYRMGRPCYSRRT